MMKRPRFGEVFFVANGARSLCRGGTQPPAGGSYPPLREKREWGALYSSSPIGATCSAFCGPSRTPVPTLREAQITAKPCMESTQSVVWNPPRAEWNQGETLHFIAGYNCNALLRVSGSNQKSRGWLATAARCLCNRRWTIWSNRRTHSR